MYLVDSTEGVLQIVDSVLDQVSNSQNSTRKDWEGSSYPNSSLIFNYYNQKCYY